MKTESKPPHVSVPLNFAYRSLPDRQIIESYIKHVDVPILKWHIQEIKFLFKETHEPAEQSLKSLINLYINSYIERKREQFHKRRLSTI